MKKEFPILPDFAEFEQSLSVAVNPFERDDNRDFMRQLQSTQNEDKHYVALFSELENLSGRLSLLVDKAEKLKPDLEKLQEEISNQRSLIWKNEEVLLNLEAEISQLEETLRHQPKDPDRADEIIRQATQLLIKGKNFKHSKIEAENQKVWLLYKRSEQSYLELFDKFKATSQAIQEGNIASAEVIRQSREIFFQKSSLSASELNQFKAENIIPEPINTQMGRPTDPSEQRSQTLELDEILSFDENISEVEPYNNITLQSFIKELEQEESQSARQKKSTVSEPELAPSANYVSHSSGTSNSFQQDFLLTAIPKLNLRSNRSKKRPQR